MNELEQLKNFIHRRLTNITRPVIGSYCHGREDTLKELLEEINKSIEKEGSE